MSELYTSTDIEIIDLIRSRLIKELGDMWYLGEITSAKLSMWYNEKMSTNQARLWLLKFPNLFRSTGSEAPAQRLQNHQGRPCNTFSVIKRNLEAYYLQAAKAALAAAKARMGQ